MNCQPEWQHAFIFKTSFVHILPKIFKGLDQVVYLHIENVLKPRVGQVEQYNLGGSELGRVHFAKWDSIRSTTNHFGTVVDSLLI